VGHGGRLSAGDRLCWGRLKDVCWWVRWACVSGEVRIGWATEVGVFKSADVCIVDFAVCRRGIGFIVYIDKDVMDHSRSEIRGRREIDSSCLSIDFGRKSWDFWTGVMQFK